MNEHELCKYCQGTPESEPLKEDDLPCKDHSPQPPTDIEANIHCCEGMDECINRTTMLEWIESYGQQQRKIAREENTEYKSLEQSFMALKDDYSEICKALGFKGDAWFGDPLVPHKEIIKKAELLQALNPK